MRASWAGEPPLERRERQRAGAPEEERWMRRLAEAWALALEPEPEPEPER